MKKKILFKSLFTLVLGLVALFLVFTLVHAEGDTFKITFDDKQIKIVTEGVDKAAVPKDKVVEFEVIVPDKQKLAEVKVNNEKQTVDKNKFKVTVTKDIEIKVEYKQAVQKLQPIQIAAIVVLVISILIPAIMALVKKIQNKQAEKKLAADNLNSEETPETENASAETPSETETVAETPVAEEAPVVEETPVAEEAEEVKKEKTTKKTKK